MNMYSTKLNHTKKWGGMLWRDKYSHSIDIWAYLSPGIETKPITFKLFSNGVTPAPMASFTSLRTLCHPLAPKLRYNSISLRPPSIICVERWLTVSRMPLMQFPMNIPHIGMTYWGFQQGSGRMIHRKANALTAVMDMMMERNASREWYWMCIWPLQRSLELRWVPWKLHLAWMNHCFAHHL